jgi:hypothetical protein
MAHLLPYFRFSIRTQLSVDEAAELLTKHVSVKRNWFKRIWMTERGFEGVVRDKTFNINPIPLDRNSFRPYLYGRIIPATNGSIVQVVATLRPVIGAVCCAMAGVLLFLITHRFIEFTHNQNAGDEFYEILVFTVFFYGLVMFSFWPAAKRAQRFITELYQDH